MRVFASLIFFFTVPLVIFITTVLYGGVSSVQIKKEFAAANIYDKLTAHIKDSFTSSGTTTEGDEGSSALVTSVLQNRVTSSYIQGKTEKFIDDTSSYIAGHTTTPPVVSFHEIKDDMIAKDPEVFTQLQNSLAEIKKQQASSSTEADVAALDSQSKMLDSLMNSDFSIPVGKNLTGLRQGYGSLKIAFPILIVILLLSIGGIVYGSATVQAKLRWVGIVFVVTGLYGFVITWFSNVFLSNGESTLLTKHNEYLDTFTPIVLPLINLFADKYKEYQNLANITLLGVGAVLLIVSFIIHSQPPAPAKTPVIKRKK